MRSSITYGYNHLLEIKTKKLLINKNQVLVYDCNNEDSVGRTIMYLIKQLKHLKPDTFKTIIVNNIENTVFKRDPVEVLAKYKRLYAAGNQTKGPFIQKTEIGLFKKLLRNNLKYKTIDKILFKKFCVLTSEQKAKLNLDLDKCTKLIDSDSKYRMKEKK